MEGRMNEIKVSNRIISMGESTRKRNPNLFAPAVASKIAEAIAMPTLPQMGKPKPLLNKTETRAKEVMRTLFANPILEQAITLRLDPPFKSYRPDLAVVLLASGQLCFIEVKAPHKYARAGIAKAACAAKTYPQFRFELWMWKDGKFEVTVLTP